MQKKKKNLGKRRKLKCSKMQRGSKLSLNEEVKKRGKNKKESRSEREREDEEETHCDCSGALIFCPERIQDADQQCLVVPSVIVL